MDANDMDIDMASGPICAMVWEGREVVKTGRQLLGATNPLASQPGTIRGDFAIVSQVYELEKGTQSNHDDLQDVGRNVCHGSDAVDSAQKEIALWFDKSEINSWKQAQHEWVYEK